MARVNLRVYRGPDEDFSEAQPFEPSRQLARKTVTVPLSHVAPVLADAVASRRNWIHDFDQDEITVSADFYEVLLAYQRFRRPAP
jgi:hypothetical protein